MKTKNNLAEEGYRFVRFDRPGLAIFQEIATGRHELFAARAGGYSGWHLKWRGTSWEFCSSANVPENKPEAPAARAIHAALDRPADYDETCIFCETGEEPGHEH